MSPGLLVALALGGVALLLLIVLRWPESVVRHPAPVWAVLGAATLLSAGLLVEVSSLEVGLRLDPSEEPLMLARDPAREAYELAIRRFGTDDRYVVALEGPDFFRTPDLLALTAMGDRVGRLPEVRRTESLVNAVDFYFDPRRERIEVGDLIGSVPSDPGELERLRERALRDPIYPKYLVGREGRAAAIDVSFHRLSDRELIERRTDEAIRAIAGELLRPDQRAYFSGRPHIKARAYHTMVRDLLRLIPLAVVVAALVLYLLTRSLRTTLLPLVASLLATLWALGAMTWVDTPLNLVTLVLPSTLIALGGLYGVHMLARYDVEATGARSAEEAALRTLRYAALPVTIAGVTTCIGFGALLLARTEATTELGLFAMLGIAFVTLISLTGVPAALALLPLRASPGGSSDASILAAILRRAAALASARSGTTLVFWGLATGVAALLVFRVEVDTDYLTFFHRSDSVRRDFETIHRLLGGPVPIYVTLESDREGTFREPEVLRAVARLERELAALPAVSNTLSMVDPIRKFNRAYEDGDPREQRIPDSREEVSDLVFLIPKSELRRFATSNHRVANVVVRTGEQGSRAIRELVAAIRTVLSTEDLLPPGIRADVTGNAIVLNRSADRIARDQFLCLGFASLAIFALMSASLRSLPLGIVAMIPNWLPVLLFFGALGAGVASLSLPTGLIGSLSLGVAIDDTVHLIVAYRRRRLRGEDPESAIETTLHQVGRPVVVTSAMLVAGFLTITASGFATLQEFGALTALTMALCLLTDLTLLPALLARTRA